MEGHANKEDTGLPEPRGELGGYSECSEKPPEDLSKGMIWSSSCNEIALAATCSGEDS